VESAITGQARDVPQGGVRSTAKSSGELVMARHVC